ncbi:hypothetical protein T4D_3897 [Trichinella pseudospiralis]|uniref:Uncharacterized protein n=1 Tax=Trichinella pseudospiralis TaxID=6337 RepID=A0A0V1FRT9_TRIPS|nr:hypothetical protein T4D_3897 [Trichinella pseudospiralis]
MLVGSTRYRLRDNQSRLVLTFALRIIPFFIGTMGILLQFTTASLQSSYLCSSEPETWSKQPTDSELNVLCNVSADAYEIEDQISMTERLYLKAEALQIELKEEEMRRAYDDWSRYQKSIGACLDPPAWPGKSVRIGNGKFPELRLLQFSGEVLDFPPLLHYVRHDRSDLGRRDEARGANEGIPVTAAIYVHAVKILKNRFSCPEKVAGEHILALWKAPECTEMAPRSI